MTATEFTKILATLGPASAKAPTTRAENLVKPGCAVLLTAGVPFGTPGSTNLMRVVWPD